MKVSSLLATKSPTVITIHPDQPVADAVALYGQHNIGSLIVVDRDNRLVGILSERDIVRHLPEYDDVMGTAVQEIMTPRVIVALPQDDVMSVAHTMTERRFRHMPVVDEGELVGIISIGDIIKYQRDQFRGEIATLETQIMAEKS
ncbi:MAG TPA: CBS domain-containing protein [Anaerolineae bacterium]|nr:CBS domain-containing protein [Chloroflexota bacterium]HIP73108.1 CBS domain-containing protein [Anaerolineae bacterium]